MAGDSTNVVLGNATANIGGDLGYLKAGGITQTPTVDVLTVDVEQLAVSPKAFYTGRGYEITFILVEPSIDNIIIAWDLPSASAGGGTVAETLDILPAADMQDSFTATPRVITVTGIVPGAAFTRTVVWASCIVTTPAPLVFSRMAYQELEITFQALYEDTTDNKVGDFSDAIA
jgi:hypothetical protein